MNLEFNNNENLLNKQIYFIKQYFYNKLIALKKSKTLYFPCNNFKLAENLKNIGFDIDILFNNEESSVITSGFQKTDINKLDYFETFDFILNDTLGCFSENDNFELLKKFSLALKPEGFLLIELLNRELILNKLKQNNLLKWSTTKENMVILENSKFDIFTGVLTTEQITVQKGKHEKKIQKRHLYTFTELKFIFNILKLEVCSIFGGYDEEKYNYNSEKLIIIVQKNL